MSKAPPSAEKISAFAAKTQTSGARNSPRRAGRVAPSGNQQERGARAQDRHEEIHMRGKVQRAVEERQDDAERGEGGLCVVAKVGRIAEDISGMPPVIVEPPAEGENRHCEPRDIAQCGPEGRSVPQGAPGFASSQGHGGADSRLLGEGSEREAECGGQDAACTSSGKVEGKSPQGERGG